MPAPSGSMTTEAAAARLAAIVDSSEDAIVSKDLDGIVQTWNPAAERLFGYTADEMVGRPITTIIPADRLAEEADVLSRIRRGIAVEHFETVRQRKDGTLIDISLSVSPIKTPDGTITGASKIARDITMQQALIRALEEASRVKDDFLAMLSHELRTPLNAVLGYTRMLRDRTLQEDKYERAIDVIERNALALSQLVSDVLDVSSIVTGKARLTRERHDVHAIALAAVDVVRHAAEAKGVTLNLRLQAGTFCICDADRMQQVLWNLLSNAIKFTPSGGHVTLAVAASEQSLEITVADTGAGIRQEHLPHVFHRFWQAEAANQRQTGSLGLGLALARHFVELHGGTIAVASEGEGRGATFAIRLPLGS
jgi:PAS domain S-box-containing protein